MRKHLASFLSSMLLVALAFAPARAGLFLSELCDPQNNYVTDRFIEIYNSGPDAVDLSGWSVVAIANNVDVTTWPLSGSLPAGQARVCGNTTTVTGFTVHFQNAQWGASGYFNWNGRAGDGAKLVTGVTIVDLVVATGTLFENADLVRIPTVTDPNPVYTPAEWTATAVLLATNASPGTHNGSPVTGPGPRVTDIVTDPLAPVAGAGVHVQASVVDTSGAIASVTLQWGTTSGSLPNSIAMALESDSTYRTTSQIPAASAGATVFHRIVAVGASATTTTSPLSYTIPGGGGGTAATLVAVGEMSDSTLLVTFSEPVEEVTAETPANYTVGALVAVDAVRDPLKPAQVTITVRNIPAGARTLTVNGVADLTGGDITIGANKAFTYVNVSIPAGYYDSAIGLRGSALRKALHLIIRNHTVKSYAYALTAFGTTDVKPNGKIWDMYSDVPDGTPAYEYAVGQTGQGGGEGFGYNREHTWPQSWFNSSSPMVSDLHMLFPTDASVNNARGNYPYGDVGTPTYTSSNGSVAGPCTDAGYSGTVFEPIDAYKGDLARAHLYVTARYLGQDASWPGSPSTNGSQFQPWAEAVYRNWHRNDPPSWKDRLRNGAVYVEQNNRNPFVDHPEFVEMIYDSLGNTGVGASPVAARVSLRPNSPNPFVGRTSVGFDLPRGGHVSLRVFDVSGRLVRTLADQPMEPGFHALDWDGRDDGGANLQAGLYFCRLEAGADVDTRRMARVK